jgi:phenylacetate-CoA ligase
MIYNEEYETLPREVLEALQLKRLKQVVQRVYPPVGFYRRSFDQAGVQPDDIKSHDTSGGFPSPPSRDLRDNYPLRALRRPRAAWYASTPPRNNGRSSRVGLHQEGQRDVA